MIQLSKIAVIFFLIGAFSGIAGCSNPETPQVKPEIVRKKISEKPESVTSVRNHCSFAFGFVSEKTSGGYRPDRPHTEEN
jgi:hypothetical protein